MKPSPGHISGAPAEAALHTLIRQFSDRSAFIRELVQNSLDAGANRIEVQLSQEGNALQIGVVDDGEGMTRSIIQNALLTLFSSTKERDQTRIGKFGVGFVSIFAVAPEQVIVETGRDGTHHRLVFDQAQRYQLFEYDTPFEGTTVTLHIKQADKAARKLVEEIKNALYFWCKYARAEIVITGSGPGWSFDEQVGAPFDLNLPCTLFVEEPDFRAILGFGAPPFAGFYNRGLTLLESTEAPLPGLSFRVEAAGLEHTLTRDNVRRDGAYEQVIARLTKLATGQLLPQHLTRLAQETDLDTWITLFRATQSPLCKTPSDLPFIPTLHGQRISLKDLQGGFFGGAELYTGGSGPLADRLHATGKHVLAVKIAQVVGERLNKKPVSIDDRWTLTEPVEGLPGVSGFLFCRFYGAQIAGKLGAWVRKPGDLEEGEPLLGGIQVVNIRHSLIETIKKLPPDLAQELIRHHLGREQNKAGSPDRVVEAILDLEQA